MRPSQPDETASDLLPSPRMRFGIYCLLLQLGASRFFFQLFFRNNSYTRIKYKERVSFVSKKKDILIVGFLSVTLFTGFTAYSQLGAKSKAAAPSASSQPAVRSATGTQIAPTVKSAGKSPAAVQEATDQATGQTPAEEAPPASSQRKKNTKTKAS